MSENQLPAAPATDPAPYAESPAPRRTWRDRMPSGRKVITAGAVVAGLAVGGAGFGAGYAVGHDDVATTGTTQTTDDFDGRGFPGDGRGPMGDVPGGPMGGTTQDGHGPGARLRRRRPARHRRRHDGLLDRLLGLAQQLTPTPRTGPPRTASLPREVSGAGLVTTTVARVTTAPSPRAGAV